MATLVDTQAAAVAAGVAEGTVRWWASMGYIRRAGTDPRGRAMYDLEDVYRVAAERASNRARKIR